MSKKDTSYADLMAWRAQNRNEPVNREALIKRLKGMLIPEPMHREEYGRNDTINILLKEIS